MAPVPGSPWKCVSRMTSLPPSPHTHTKSQERSIVGEPAQTEYHTCPALLCMSLLSLSLSIYIYTLLYLSQHAAARLSQGREALM